MIPVAHMITSGAVWQWVYFFGQKIWEATWLVVVLLVSMRVGMGLFCSKINLRGDMNYRLDLGTL